MATSGTSNFNPNFDDLLQDAVGMVGGGPILAEELTAAQRGIDYLLTQIQNKNILLHKVETTIVAVSTSSVTLNNTIIDVHTVQIRDDNDIETSMWRLGFENWASLTSKGQTGKPSQYWFDRRLASGILNVWPVPNAEYELIITVQKTAEDTIRAYNNVDVPRRFLPALLYGLAYWIGLRRMNRVPTDRLQMLKMEYEQQLRDAMREDRERASTFIKLGR